MAEEKKTDDAKEEKMDDKKADMPMDAKTADDPDKEEKSKAADKEAAPVSEEKEYAKDGSYGKSSMWKWILIYIVLGVIVYGAYYYYAIANKTSY